MSDDDTCSPDQQAALEPPGVYANQVFLNVIDGMIRISFGLKAGEHLRYTEAVTIGPGLALALRDLIETYVQPPAPASAEPAKKARRSESARLKEIRALRTTPH